MTAGVIQPAQILSRGKFCLSSTRTSRPALTSCQAQVEPAGPPPTIRTSQESARSLLIKVGARPRHVVVVLAREHYLEQLQLAALERRLRAGKIHAPDAHEALAIHFLD